jgi:hypothetical protein
MVCIIHWHDPLYYSTTSRALDITNVGICLICVYRFLSLSDANGSFIAAIGLLGAKRDAPIFVISKIKLEYNFWDVPQKSSAWFTFKHSRLHALNTFTTNGTLKTDYERTTLSCIVDEKPLFRIRKTHSWKLYWMKRWCKNASCVSFRLFNSDGLWL